MANVKWTNDEKLKALAIAEASSIREASIETGIPEGTLKRWRKELKGSDESDPNEPNDPNRTITSKKIETLTEEAVKEAKAEVREYVADRVKQVSDGLLELVELAKQEAANLISTGKDPDDSKAQWLRSVVGAIAQGIEKHQLLEGKPTSRQEVKQDVYVDERYEKTLRDIQENLAELRRPVGIQSTDSDLGSSQGDATAVKH